MVDFPALICRFANFRFRRVVLTPESRASLPLAFFGLVSLEFDTRDPRQDLGTRASIVQGVDRITYAQVCHFVTFRRRFYSWLLKSLTPTFDTNR